MIPIYEHFAREWRDELDFSDDMLYQLYENESKGIGIIDPKNGFAHGKKILSITVEMWKEDLWITIFPWELIEDPDIPTWWILKIFSINK